jgi:hydroxymethylpyrimidine pyrophosphatase-like HAD family hydrolase
MDGVPVSTGSTIVATVESRQLQLLRVIRDLGLDWHVIPNRTARTALPVDVTKATGLQRALRDIGTTAAHTVGVGDAENDVAFLRICGLAAAVSNALTCVRATADIVTEEARGAGVARLIDWWLTGESGAIGRSVPGSVRDARRRPR